MQNFKIRENEREDEERRKEASLKIFIILLVGSRSNPIFCLLI